MKKKTLISLIFLLLATLLSTSVMAFQNPYSPQQNQNDQSLSLNSQALGFHGPFSIGSEYRENYGFIVNGRFTEALGDRDAVSLFLQGGKEQGRVNATWALLLTRHQRIKLSIERLWQDMGFDFTTGDVQQWMAQNAYGAAYELLLNHGWLHDINADVYYAHVDSKHLNSIFFIGSDGALYENFRHIAGSTDKYVTAGVDLTPTALTKIGLNLNYEAVDFNTHYNTSNDDEKGLGFGVSLQQILTKHIQLKLLANDSQSYDNYGAQLAILLPAERGTSFQVNLNAQRHIGRHDLPNDSIFSLVFVYRWGLGSNYNNQFALIRNNNIVNLATWAATPAVEMPQVLAIKDEKVVRIYQPSQLESNLTQASPYRLYNLYFHSGQHVNIALLQYIPVIAHYAQHLKITHLPKEWRYNQQANEITGFIDNPPKVHYPLPIYIKVQNEINHHLQSPSISIVLMIHLSKGKAPYPNANKVVDPINVEEGHALPTQTFEIASTDPNSKTSLFINPNGKDHPITQVSLTNPDKASGLSCAINKAKTQMTCAGTGETPGTYQAEIKVKDSLSKSWSKPRTITFNVNSYAPVWHSDPNNQNDTISKAITPVNLAASFYNPPYSGNITFNPNNIQSISVTNEINNATQTLNASQLGQHGIKLSGSTLEGSLDNDSALAGQYLITYKAKNDVGFANKAASFTLTVSAPPARNGQQPQDLLTYLGNSITPVNLEYYFINPPDSGNVSFSSNDKKSITVISPNGSSETLAQSALHNNGNGLYLSENTLEGTIPSNIVLGNYTIEFAAKNSAGFANQMVSFTLNVQSHATILSCPTSNEVENNFDQPSHAISVNKITNNGETYTFNGSYNFNKIGNVSFKHVHQTGNNITCTYQGKFNKIDLTTTPSLPNDAYITTRSSGYQKKEMICGNNDDCVIGWTQDN